MQLPTIVPVLDILLRSGQGYNNADCSLLPVDAIGLPGIRQGIIEFPHQGSEFPHLGLPGHDLSVAERGDPGGILHQTRQSGRWRQRRCSSWEETDLFHEGVGERANASWRMVATYYRRSVFSLRRSRIPRVRGMSRLDDGSAGYVEVEDKWLLKVGL